MRRAWLAGSMGLALVLCGPAEAEEASAEADRGEVEEEPAGAPAAPQEPKPQPPQEAIAAAPAPLHDGAAAGADPARGAPSEAESPAQEQPPPGELKEQPLPLGGTLAPKGRLIVGLRSEEENEWARRWGIRQARFGFVLRDDLYRVEVEADLAEASVLNDAWLELRPLRDLRFTVGRFKLPFGAFRLASVWDLPLTDRPAIASAVVDLGFGGRDLGASVEYELGPARLEAAVAQGIGYGAESPKETGLLRATLSPVAFARLGLSLGRAAVFAGGAGDAIGVDLRLRSGGTSLLAEWLRAENERLGLEEEGGAAYLARRIELPRSFWLEPAVGADHRKGRGEGYAVVLGGGHSDRILARVGVRRGPFGSEGPDATRIELQLGVQP